MEEPKEETNLVKHARRELQLAGIGDTDADYGGALDPAVMELIEVFSAQGHSGASAGLCLAMFYRLAQFKALSPLTDDPAEWEEVTDRVLTPEQIAEGQRMWQNIRQGSTFSKDGGKTWKDLELQQSGESQPHKGVSDAKENNVQGRTESSTGGNETSSDGGVSTQPATEPKDSKAPSSSKKSGNVGRSKPPVVKPKQADSNEKA